MRSFTLGRGGGNFTVFLVILFVFVGVATFGYLQRTDKLAEFRVNMFSSIGTDEIALEEDIDVDEEELDLSIGITDKDIQDNETEDYKEEEQEQIVVSLEGKSYEETAETGEGITNLVRRAIKRYSDENGIEITSEQKVFVEDHVQNHIGDRVLQIGETITITEDLIVEGMNKSQELTGWELEHLENFSELVWTPGFGIPRGM
ncbi:MAG: hypothetical protein U9Q96_01835 [Patescibacteria group bacterium]|nr:hypothetical protein [Patescibacteria group bacterium]